MLLWFLSVGGEGRGLLCTSLSLLNLLGSAQQLCKMFEIWPLSIYYTVGYHQNLLLLLREFCSQDVAGRFFCASPTRSHKMDFSEIMTVWIDGFEQPVFTCISSISQSINNLYLYTIKSFSKTLVGSCFYLVSKIIYNMKLDEIMKVSA